MVRHEGGSSSIRQREAVAWSGMREAVVSSGMREAAVASGMREAEGGSSMIRHEWDERRDQGRRQ